MILIVDDEPRQRHFIVKTISELRPEKKILEAGNGQEALEMIISYPVTSVITDIRMPHMDGLAFVSECKKHNRDILVVFLSAYMDFEYARKALQIGAIDYVVKPLNREKLNGILEKIDNTEAEKMEQNAAHMALELSQASHKYRTEKLLAEAVAALNLSHAQKLLASVLDRVDCENQNLTQLKTYLYCIFIHVCGRNQLAFTDGDYIRFKNNIRKNLSACTEISALRTMAEDILASLIYELSNTQAATAESLIACRQYMEEHYMDDLARDDLAARFHFSSSYFSVLFKKTFGATFSEYLTEIRMKKAAHLLEERESLADVAQKTGYNDVKYFLRVFKRHFGCTPNEYRHRRGQEIDQV